jgi:hypothetical protein
MWLCRQAEAAAKEIMGKMPDPTALALNSFEAKIASEREAFMNRKRIG